MAISTEFKELFECLNSNRVEYLVVGGYALAFHGAPRFTGDIDLLVKPTQANAERILQALDDFGFGGLGLKANDFTQTGQVIQLGYPPARVDLLTSISGVSWEEAWLGAADGELVGASVRFIGREQFIKNKRATGRTQDKADIDALGAG